MKAVEAFLACLVLIAPIRQAKAACLPKLGGEWQVSRQPSGTIKYQCKSVKCGGPKTVLYVQHQPRGTFATRKTMALRFNGSRGYGQMRRAGSWGYVAVEFYFGRKGEVSLGGGGATARKAQQNLERLKSAMACWR